MEEKNDILNQLAQFWLLCTNHQDDITAQKTKRLAHKLYNNELVVGFCGHFSAGKSAMINSLMGENLLPSSPIPTSANLVAIHTGESKNVILTLLDEKKIQLMPPLDESSILKLGRNGQDIKRIDIYREHSSVPQGVTVLDTPGIDSVDDLHKQATDSAIHIADLIFYVMDYNHVQSQLNFDWIRSMSAYRPVHAIVNQIDKHNEEELSFETYKKLNEEAFRAGGAYPHAFYYTSLKEHSHPFNQLSNIRTEIDKIIENKDKMMIRTAASSLELLKREHESFLTDQLDQMMDTYEDFLSLKKPGSREEILEAEKEFKNKDQVFTIDDWEHKFNKKRDQVIQSAYLMPSDVREKAGRYLEANEQSFKMGLFFSSKKTAEEKARREKDFVHLLNKTVVQQLDWHLKNICHSFLKDAGIKDREIEEDIELLSFKIDASFVHSRIKPGAEINGEALLNYCSDLSDHIQKQAKQRIEEIKKKILQRHSDEIENNLGGSESKSTVILQKANALRTIIKIEDQLKRLKTLQPSQESGKIASWINEWEMERNNMTQVSDLNTFQETSDEKSTINQSSEEKRTDEAPDEARVLHNLEVTAKEIADLKGFNRQHEHLLTSMDKIQNKDFTIALFGAFSAGKSSFANALLGSKALPVSPNPTTASINRIKPASASFPNGTVKVYFKKERDLLEDLQLIFRELEMNPQSLEQAYEKVPEACEKKETSMDAKINFLKAFHSGWPHLKNHLNSELQVDQSQFEDYVAKEEQSCFVEAIDYYLESAISDKGVTIVDTPGADSINARHTDVSFEYIRRADAVLFVTYYNHAFARADREFLIQLGRVKDSFELDKMFFIVNAVDLAETEEEKDQVITYMKNQLINFGIRHPRIFGVSSQQAISSRPSETKKSGIDAFNQSFHSFLEDDLLGMAVKTAQVNTGKTVLQLEKLIENAEQDSIQKELKIDQLKQAKEKIAEQFGQPELNGVHSRINQELDELFIYMEQRVFFRFTDFFKESFHPTLFVDYAASKALNKAMSSLLNSLGYDFSQELKVVNHRIAQYIQRQLKEQLELEWSTVETILPDELKPSLKIEDMELLSFSPMFTEFEPSDFKKELSAFKNTKLFFEKNQKQIIRELLEERLKREGKKLLSDQKARIENWIDLHLSAAGKELYTRWREDLFEQIEGQLSGYQSQEVMEEWKKSLEAIHKRSFVI
ncbi:dynamin family protein [Jeotgalibacillus sp. ET6]|uniref:dynamin family protein n=1 Tax=Jeotgalibacillus sp. ET6 TaxID=3037260 RepID=UPI00241869C2|nr:dynamin family protein [Jeotgalibacillus sp. ET6]MDG5470597.1 dynamin family protein [Jeotgalibacillus sp. ET6]